MRVEGSGSKPLVDTFAEQVVRAVAAMWVLILAARVVNGDPPLVIIVSAIGVVASATTVFIVPTRPILALHIAATIAVGSVVAVSLGAGGARSPTLVAISLVPAMMSFSASPRAGLVWLGIVEVLIGAIVVLTEFDFLPEPRSQRFGAAIPAMAWAVASYTIGLAAWRAAARNLAQAETRRSEADHHLVENRKLREEVERRVAELHELNRALGEANGKLTSANDELARARDDAMQRAQDANAFLSRMSHEIRTPLNGVLGLTDVLLGGKLDPETRDHVDTIRKSGESLRKIVDEVLELARLDAGRVHLTEEPVDVMTVAEDVADLFAPSASAKGIELVAIGPEQLAPQVLVDPLRLRQIISNLVSNAVKFTERGSVSMELAYDAKQEELHVVVADTGPGIAPAMLENLFVEFMQTRQGVAKGGSGLGLVIARKLARAMGGDLVAESEVGRGTRFALTVRARLASQPVSSDDVQPTSMGRVVALLEDREATARAFQSIAAAIELSVDVFADVHALEDALRAKPSRYLGIIAGTKDPLDAASTVWSRLPTDRLTVPVVLAQAPTVGRGEGPVTGLPPLLLPPRRSRLLRCVRSLQGRARETGRSLPVQAPGSLRALVIDDEPVNRKVARLLASRLGWTVEEAPSALEGIEKLGRSRYHCVLIDLEMPDVDGIEAARRIVQAIRPLPWLVLQTASIDPSVRERATAAGMVDALPKPIVDVRLRSVLEHASRFRLYQDERAAQGLDATLVPDSVLGELGVAIALGETERSYDLLGEIHVRARGYEAVEAASVALHDAMLHANGIAELVVLERALRGSFPSLLEARPRTRDERGREADERTDAAIG